MVLLRLSLTAQMTVIKPMTVGDVVPEITFTNLINYSTKTAKLSDFKGKLVLLDFWSSWCGACIQLFPYMVSLKRQFKDDLQIVLVNARSKQSGDDALKINNLLKRVHQATGINIDLPVVYDAPELDALFPHKYLPHEVLLDGNGKVLAITTSEEITPINIKALLAGTPLKLHYKQDDFNFTTEIPLFVKGNGGDGASMLYRSMFAPYTEGLRNGIGMKNSAAGSRLYIYNQSLEAILKIAYPTEMALPKSRILLTDTVIQKLWGSSTDKRPGSLYCYDLLTPTTTESSLKLYLRQDLARVFGVQLYSSKKIMDCWVLTATPSIIRSYTKGGTPEWSLADRYRLDKFMKNQPVSTIVTAISSFTSIPIVDETGITEHLDIKLPTNLENTTAVLEALKFAGFDVRKEKRELPVTIISSQKQ